MDDESIYQVDGKASKRVYMLEQKSSGCANFISIIYAKSLI